RDGQGRRARTDQRDALADLFERWLGKKWRDVVAKVGGNALQATDCHRLSVYPAAAAGRLAGTVTGAAEDARKDVGFPVEEVRFGVSSLGDQPQVFRHIGVCRTCVLTVHHLMVGVGGADVPIDGHLEGAEPSKMLPPGTASRKSEGRLFH